MRVFIFIFFLLGAISMGAQSSNPKPVKIKITGEIDTTYQATSLVIVRQNDNIRKPTAEIPVVNGIIDFDFETDEPDRFFLYSMRDMMERATCIPISFFAEDGEIHFAGGKDEGGSQCLNLKLVESTSPLNSRLIEYNTYKAQNFQNRLDSVANLVMGLEEYGYSSAGKALLMELDDLSGKIRQFPDSFALLQHRSELYQRLDSLERERAMYTPEYYKLYDASRAIVSEMVEYEIDTYGGPDGDLFSLSVFFQAFMMTKDNEYLRERIISVYINNFRDRFANTIMGRRMDEAVVGYEVSHDGGRYPDYQLPDANGNIHNIHDLINGRLVLIDLWGSTCGPCRVNSRLMIPVYNEFKDKGFDIIGVAREYGSLDSFNQAVQKDGYPWRQLIELDDSSGVFNLHGIPNSMGGTYLVGPSEPRDSDNGTNTDIRILLINPTHAQRRDFLIKYYE